MATSERVVVVEVVVLFVVGNCQVGFASGSSPVIIIIIIIIIIINPLTDRVVGALQMILQPVFSVFHFLHCSLRLGELQACPFPDVVFPPLPLSALSSSPFHCALQDLAFNDSPVIIESTFADSSIDLAFDDFIETSLSMACQRHCF